MSNLIDQKYLKEAQYKTADNLSARIALHQRFNTNPYGWFAWLWDQFDLQPGMRLLEVGCGQGDLWRTNLQRQPENIRLYLADLSSGMVDQSRSNLSRAVGFSFLAADAQKLPFPSGQFDRVVANHMLYHVPDMGQAASEFARLLKPGGRLLAATNGTGHMRELTDLIREFEPTYSTGELRVRRFSLQTAPQVLSGAFRHVEVHVYADNLLVTEWEPLLAYALSMWGVLKEDTPAQRQRLSELVQARFAACGGRFPITKSQGLVMAWN